MKEPELIGPDPTILTDLLSVKMPFGKYKGYTLRYLPENYLIWMKREGFPKGRLGMQLETLLEIKINGLEFLLDKIKAEK